MVPANHSFHQLPVALYSPIAGRHTTYLPPVMARLPPLVLDVLSVVSFLLGAALVALPALAIFARFRLITWLPSLALCEGKHRKTIEHAIQDTAQEKRPLVSSLYACSLPWRIAVQCVPAQCAHGALSFSPHHCNPSPKHSCVDRAAYRWTRSPWCTANVRVNGGGVGHGHVLT